MISIPFHISDFIQNFPKHPKIIQNYFQIYHYPVISELYPQKTESISICFLSSIPASYLPLRFDFYENRAHHQPLLWNHVWQLLPLLCVFFVFVVLVLWWCLFYSIPATLGWCWVFLCFNPLFICCYLFLLCFVILGKPLGWRLWWLVGWLAGCCWWIYKYVYMLYILCVCFFI